MSTKRNSKNVVSKQPRHSSKTSADLYSRASIQLFKPSTKLNNESWSNYYTNDFQKLWDKLYLSFVENETNSKKPQVIPDTFKLTSKHDKNGKKRKSKKPSIIKSCHQHTSSRLSVTAVPKKGDFPFLLSEICESLRFGLMNIKYAKDANKNRESDILSFYFTIRFQTNYKKKWFLYLKFLYDDVIYKKDIESEIRKKKCQITCDFSYGEINRIINNMSSKKFEVNVSLPSNILIEIFQYIRPIKYIALYSSIIKESDDDFDIVENSQYDKKHFNLSNIEWVCNFFGLETWHFVKLFKIIMKFLEHNDVIQYIKKEKDYNKTWDEWREAQQELNQMYDSQLSDDNQY
eukprot:405659_1